jgi:hypothetical protein
MRARLTWAAVAAALAVACGGGHDDSEPAATSSPDEGGAGPVSLSPPDDDLEPFAACSADTDCIAVSKVGCCHLGWKVAVNKDMARAYAGSFHCPNPAPICIQILVIDSRTPQCNFDTGLCELVQQARTTCGDGPACTGDASCAFPRGEEMPTCVRPP